MTQKKEDTTDGFSYKSAAAYSFGQLSLITAYQAFTFLIFTFYYAVVNINTTLITIAFIIWSIWNAFNDPIMGYISDRTHTKWGRRTLYIMIALGPLALVMVFLFTPPLSFGVTDEITNFFYFLIIIILFELFYTMYDINLTSLFPEIFITKEERLKANNVRQIFAIFGLIFAFVLPGLFISDYSAPESLPEYQVFGIVLMIIIIVVGLIFLKFSPRDKPEFQQDYKMMPNIFTSIKLCLKNKSFRWIIPGITANMFVYLMLPTIVPLYGKYVLNIGEGETLLLSLLLGFSFISAAIFLTVLWKPIVQKIGLRKTWMISLTTWILTLTPFMFIQDKFVAIIVFILVGIGLAGSLYIVDLIIYDIIDEDEVNTGIRREASYIGVYILFLRFATIFVFLAISLVFTNVGWAVYDPETVTPEVIFGLRALIFIFPTIALVIAILSAYKYPLDGEKLKNVKEQLKKIHEEKKSKI